MLLFHKKLRPGGWLKIIWIWTRLGYFRGRGRKNIETEKNKILEKFKHFFNSLPLRSRRTPILLRRQNLKPPNNPDPCSMPPVRLPRCCSSWHSCSCSALSRNPTCFSGIWRSPSLHLSPLRRAKRGAFLMDQGGGERAKKLRIMLVSCGSHSRLPQSSLASLAHLLPSSCPQPPSRGSCSPPSRSWYPWKWAWLRCERESEVGLV